MPFLQLQAFTMPDLLQNDISEVMLSQKNKVLNKEPAQS